jgi:hypothetical protein
MYKQKKQRPQPPVETKRIAKTSINCLKFSIFMIRNNNIRNEKNTYYKPNNDEFKRY